MESAAAAAAAAFDVEKTKGFIEQVWDDSIVPALCEYVKIPNQSPLFDPQWATNGYMDQAIQLEVDWVKKQQVPGLEVKVIAAPERTPVIVITVEATTENKEDTVLLYGHLDKQPPLTEGWEEGIGPYTPVIKDGKLYGRGGADDGYSIFAAVTAIKALKEQGVPHSRCVILVEACEESGSRDLPFYIEQLRDTIKTPSLIICLDSGCGNYDQLWLTTSLRGAVVGTLQVKVLTEGVHSGKASGIVPSSFRILRHVLNRLEDSETGKIIPECFYCPIPEQRLVQAKEAAETLGEELHTTFPWAGKTKPVTHDLTELLLNETWRPQLSVTGVAGMPTLEAAGNVLRTHTAVKLSLRIPPNVRAKEASDNLKALFEKGAPYDAEVAFIPDKSATGWESPQVVDWLKESLDKSSNAFFGKGACYQGEGGSIPFMGMLGELFPKAQFMITGSSISIRAFICFSCFWLFVSPPICRFKTDVVPQKGVLGPNSNAHGPNEFLHIKMGKGVTYCVASVLADQAHHQA
ncbi:Acetylornithine deacetylase/Succinyl-diaminopimelate desuccinylase [Balamuthia mandrillaris]